MPEQTPGYVRANAEWWEGRRANQLEVAERHWSADEPVWGVFAIPETMVGLLPDDLEGRTTFELGCGTGYVSAWLARRGARPVAIDPTPGQLAIARRLQHQYQLPFPLIRAVAEQVPLAGGTFDLAISEYGAAIWADPYRWIPEAARLLRPGGQLIFLGNSSLLVLCMPELDGVPAGARLLRDHFGMHRFDWPDNLTVEFHLGHGDWIRLFRASGLEVEDLIELRPPVGAPSNYEFVEASWAARWPCEEVWVTRRT